jgi:hypothetical protein
MKYIVTIFLSMIMISGLQAQKTSKKKTDGLLRHVVLFKFKSSSDSTEIKKVEDAFRALPSKIKEVVAFEWGTNNSPENLNQDYTHCFFVSFKSEKDRDVYLPHPAHKKFVDILRPHLDKVLVVDYWAKK